MKAFLQYDKIINFVDDKYVAGNKEIDGDVHPFIKLKEIKGFSPDIDMEEVSKNHTNICGCFIYFLDEEGIVQKLVLEEQPEYIAYQKLQRAEAYKNEADPIFFKYQRGEATQQEWQDKIQAIRDKFPY